MWLKAQVKSRLVGAKLASRPAPIGDVFASRDERYQWQSTGDDPSFLLRGFSGLASGWYMLELRVDSNQPSLLSKLYFDYGQGYAEHSSACVTYKTGKLVKRIIYIERGLRHMRFDPMEKLADFSIINLRMVRLTEQFARKRILHNLSQKKLLEFLPKLRSMETKKLYGMYSEGFMQNHAQITSEQYQLYLEMESELFDSALQIEQFLRELDSPVTFSLILPTYNTPAALLEETIQSVLAQTYPHWQLCIADDCSTDPETRALIQRYSDQEPRIDAIFREQNGHISNASNSAIELAKGDYCALLDHDDLLSVHALYEAAKAIQENPNLKFIYTDEDKVDISGNRFYPHFKTAWNPDLLLSHNYITHLTIIETQLIREIGGFREGVEGSQDYDIILRATALLTADQITHIPKILYHWRAIPGSTALQASFKDYTVAAGEKALTDFLASKGYDRAKVLRTKTPNMYQVQWAIKNEDLVSIIIPTKDKLELLSQCVESVLEKTDYAHYEILIVDNASEEPATLEYLAEIQKNPRISVLEYPKAFNYSAINNFAAEHAKGRYLCLLNNDITVITGDWLGNMLAQAQREDIGCVGVKLLFPNSHIQHAGIVIDQQLIPQPVFQHVPGNDHGYCGRLRVNQNYPAVTAACLMLERSLFERVGGLDEQNFEVAYNDVDLCLKVQELGFRNLWLADTVLFHHESASRGYDVSSEKVQRLKDESQRFQTLWAGRVDSADFLNPNMNSSFTIRL